MVFLPWTPTRGPPRHTFWLLIYEEALTPMPSWGSVSLLSSKLADAYGLLGSAWFSGRCTALALQTFTIHEVLKLGVFPTSQACGMTQAYSPRAACSHRSRGSESRPCEMRCPVGCAGCFILRLLHRISSSSACSLKSNLPLA